MNYKKLFEIQREKILAEPLAQQHRSFSMMLLHAEYWMNTENIVSTDCSGTLSFPLLCMNFNIRTRADEFYKRIYVKSAANISRYYHRIIAIFYLKNGIATHVSPIVGRGVILDAVNEEQPVQLKALEPVMRWYQRNGYDVDIRELAWEKVEELSGDKSAYWDLDDILKKLREM